MSMAHDDLRAQAEESQAAVRIQLQGLIETQVHICLIVRAGMGARVRVRVGVEVGDHLYV